MRAARRPGRLHRATAVLAAALLGAPLFGAAPAGAVPGTGDVSVQVLSLSPTIPTITGADVELVVSLRITNTSSHALQQLHLSAVRGGPLTSQQSLDAQIADPQDPDPDVSQFLPSEPVAGTLAAGASEAVAYRATVGLSGQLCLCAQGGVYPLRVTVSATDDPAVLPTDVGHAETYVPSFYTTAAQTAPPPVRVSWVWPMLDRPHRAAVGSEFTDDDLAGELATTGRLYRSLQVLQKTSAAGVRMTVVLDPELIDEVRTMSGGYTVRAPGAATATTGTGAQLAANWLTGLRVVLASEDVSVTPVGDPDVTALVAGHATALLAAGPAEADLLTRVRTTLARPTLQQDIAWPQDSTTSSAALATYAGLGTRTLVLDDATLTGGDDVEPRPDALASLPGAPGLEAAVTDASVQAAVADTVSVSGGGRGALPRLVAEVAVRSAENVAQGRAGSYLVLTPPRYVDPDPTLGAAAVLATTRTPWTVPLTVRAARSTVTAVDDGAPVLQPASGPAPAVSTALAARSAGADVAAIALPAPVTSGASTSPAGDATSTAQETAMVQGLHDAAVRLVSSGWTQDPAHAAQAAAALARTTARISGSVSIIDPNRGYTLTSNDAPLPLTLRNDFDFPVQVRVAASAVGGVLGLTVRDIGLQRIPAHGLLPSALPTHVERSGRFEVQIALATPARQALGTPVTLEVTSTALGPIGVIITAVALGVLVIAVVVRLVRRQRARRAAQ